MAKWRAVLGAGCVVWAGVAGAADDLGLDDLLDVAKPADAGGGLHGFAEFSAARAYESPSHWSKLRARLNLQGGGRLSEQVKWKLSGRLDADAAPDIESDVYPSAVRRDRRSEAMIREAYLDISAGNWDYRLGRQHVVWGEMVGLFFADVVSARDTREFFLPEFDQMRIPQWAARAEYFGDDWHGELLWIPVPSVDNIGKPGGDFYPFVAPEGARFAGEDKPDHRLGNMNWGARLSALIDGWDVSGFFYRSTDTAPTFYRTSLAPLTFEARHDRINQVGATFSKDMGRFVLKGEAVHTSGRKFNTTDLSAPNGLVPSDTLDYVVGVDVPLARIWRVNAQYYARRYFDHRDGMVWDKNEQGATLLVNRQFGDSLEAEVLLVSSLNGGGYMVRPKVVWQMDANWRGTAGLDVFGGAEDGVFGRFDQSDRAYVEVRRAF